MSDRHPQVCSGRLFAYSAGTRAQTLACLNALRAKKAPLSMAQNLKAFGAQRRAAGQLSSDLDQHPVCVSHADRDRKLCQSVGSSQDRLDLGQQRNSIWVLGEQSQDPRPSSPLSASLPCSESGVIREAISRYGTSHATGVSPSLLPPPTDSINMHEDRYS